VGRPGGGPPENAVNDDDGRPPDLPEPPDAESLADFPRFVIPTDTRLYRVHLAGREPNYFAGDHFGRFNPPPGDTTFGTMYCSLSPEGGFIEVLCRGGIPIVGQVSLIEREISTLRPVRPLDVADFTNPAVLGGFGITGSISAGGASLYGVTRRWAAALHAAGFDGLRYRARHDPSLSQVSFALFGEHDTFDDKLVGVVRTHGMLPLDQWSDTVARYGITVVPHGPLP
jgi:RES domain